MKSYISPGTALAEALRLLDLSQEDFAQIIGKPSRVVSEIVNEKRSLNSVLARDISTAFDTLSKKNRELTKMKDPLFWLNLQYESDVAKDDVSDARQDISLRSRLYEVVPVRELRQRGLLGESRKAADLQVDVLSLYNKSDFNELVNSIDLEIEGTDFRAKNNNDKYSLGSWLLLAKTLAAKSKNKKSYDKEKVLTIAESAYKYTNDPQKGVNRILKDFNDAGLTIRVFSSFPRSKVDGAATFTANGEPLVVLSMRYNRIDNFFFTLLHEVGHLILGHATESNTCYDDFTDESQSDLKKEKDADKFAERCLRTDDLGTVNTDSLNKRAIVKIAEKKKVHTGLIVGSLQHKGLLEYWNHREYLEKIRSFLDPKYVLGKV